MAPQKDQLHNSKNMNKNHLNRGRKNNLVLVFIYSCMFSLLRVQGIRTIHIYSTIDPDQDRTDLLLHHISAKKVGLYKPQTIFSKSTLPFTGLRKANSRVAGDLIVLIQMNVTLKIVFSGVGINLRPHDHKNSTLPLYHKYNNI